MLRLAILVLSLLFMACPAQAVQFDANDDALELSVTGTEVDFDTGSSGSVSFCLWLKRDDAAGGNEQIFTKRDDLDTGNSNTTAFDFGFNAATDSLYFYTKGGATSWACETGVVLNDTNWHHVCQEYDFDSDQTDCTPGYKVWIDGSGESVSNSFGTVSDPIQTDENVFVGCIGDPSTDGDGAEVFEGQIENFAVWMNTNLTDQEVVLMSSARNTRIALQIQPSSLKMFTPLLDVADGVSADGETFLDQSGNNNGLTGSDGTDDSGMTGKGESLLSFP